MEEVKTYQKNVNVLFAGIPISLPAALLPITHLTGSFRLEILFKESTKEAPVLQFSMLVVWRPGDLLGWAE